MIRPVHRNHNQSPSIALASIILTGRYNINPDDPNQINFEIDHDSDSVSEVWHIGNGSMNNYGIEIDGKAYFMTKHERAEAFIERIRDVLNAEIIKFHNWKVEQALSNIE